MIKPEKEQQESPECSQPTSLWSHTSAPVHTSSSNNQTPDCSHHFMLSPPAMPDGISVLSWGVMGAGGRLSPQLHASLKRRKANNSLLAFTEQTLHGSLPVGPPESSQRSAPTFPAGTLTILLNQRFSWFFFTQWNEEVSTAQQMLKKWDGYQKRGTLSK